MKKRSRSSKNSSKYSLWQNVLAALRLYWDISKLSLLSYVALASIQVVSSILIIFFTSRIIGELSKAVQGQAVVSQALYTLLAFNLLAVFAERFAWRWLNLIERQAWIRWYVRMAVDYNSAVANLDMSQHHDAEFQKTLIKLNTEYTYTPQNFANYILQLFHASARLLSTLIIVLGFAPGLVPIMILSLLPGFATERWLSKLKWNLWGEKGDKNRLAWRIMHFLTHKDKLQETKIFATKDFLLQRLNTLHQEFYNRQLRNIRKVQGRAFLSLLSEVAVLAGISVWLIQRVLAGSLDLAGFAFYSGIIGFMKDLFMLFDTKPALPRPKNPVALPRPAVPNIEFRNVSFKYPNSDTFSLKNVSFVIKPGEKIAIVGENGAGKTTMVNLLLRFYDTTEGQILINGADIREVDLSSYYSHIGVLFQKFNDYPFSVRDNIGLGRVEAFDDNERVHAAARLADAEKFIQRYPKKYEQTLEVGFKDGIEPSGGQWQRIALARVLFRDPGILILDEPTAAIDAKSEYQIFKTLEDHSKGKTTIVISHRFSTVRTAKKIYVIDNGEIIESGGHNELMKIKNGQYHEMFNKQAEGYR